MDPSALTSFDNFNVQSRRNRTAAIVWMPVMNAATFIGIPLLIWTKGYVEWAHVWIFLLFFGASSMAITMGYHRFFAHSTFKSNRVVEFLLLFFGAGAYEESALKWASMHRRHHQFTDTDKDPYNIKRGFFYAHMGWFMFYKHSINYNNVKDLEKSPLVRHQHENFQMWALASGVVLPLSIGLFMGSWPSALLWTVAAKVTMVGHTAFFINSFAHTFGSRPYDATVSARDHWLGAIITNGEGYHNFHHAFPQDYRNGVHWYHWDPTKWAIWALSLVGITRELRRTPKEKILAAKAAVLASHN